MPIFNVRLFGEDSVHPRPLLYILPAEGSTCLIVLLSLCGSDLEICFRSPGDAGQGMPTLGRLLPRQWRITTCWVSQSLNKSVRVFWTALWIQQFSSWSCVLLSCLFSYSIISFSVYMSQSFSLYSNIIEDHINCLQYMHLSYHVAGTELGHNLL